MEPVDNEVVDEVVERLMDRADASGAALLGEGGLLTEVTRAVLERALEAEMSGHLGYGKQDGRRRNGESIRDLATLVDPRRPRRISLPTTRGSGSGSGTNPRRFRADH